jgi:serine/threonine protein phosphatase 1
MELKKVFAIGDIHGCADELNQLLAKLPIDSDSTLVFLGDYVDRGPNSKDVIQTIIELSHDYHVEALMGNHEDMMLEFIRDPSSPLAGFFILNGGSATLASYAMAGNQYEFPDAHVHFLKNLKLFYETEKHFFVHAGVPDIKLNEIQPERDRNELLWVRKKFLDSRFRWNKTIVHGHTPVDAVDIQKHRINLDTGCVYDGSLTAMEVHSGEVYQVSAGHQVPHTYLQEDPQSSRIAMRFLGAIPVFVETDTGYEQFMTVNFNEFGLLIVDTSGSEKKVFEVGQVLQGKIGDLSTAQMNFVGQVVRHQRRGKDIAYGVKMLEPLGQSNRSV